jgi:hypothetical protein
VKIKNRRQTATTFSFSILSTFCLSLLLSICDTIAAGEIPQPSQPVVPGIEAGVWVAEAWGNSGTAEKTASGALPLLKLTYGGAKDKTAFKRLTNFGLSSKGGLRLLVFCGEESPPKFAVAICTTGLFLWQESKPIELKKGWNTVEVPLGTNEWKSEASGWKHTAALEAPQDVRAIDLIVYGSATGALYVTGFQYDPDDKSAQFAVLLQQLRGEDHAAREKAEDALVEIGPSVVEPLTRLGEDESPEVLLRAASALHRIAQKTELAGMNAQQREEEALDEARQRAEAALKSLQEQQAKLLDAAGAAKEEIARGRAAVAGMKQLSDDKRESYRQLTEKIEAAIKALDVEQR